MGKKAIGRNDPCPCGSGKKFKKCCQNKNIPDIPRVPSFTEKNKQNLPPHETIDYGTPVINEDFYRNNNVHKLSAPRLLYTNLISPQIETAVAEIMNQVLTRGKNEANLIHRTDDVPELINIMKRGPDSLNIVLLIKKLLDKKEIAVPLILQELRRPQIAACVELAVRVLFATRVDYSDKLIEIITQYQREPYTVSLLCMLVGFYDNPKSEELLWDYYRYFREYFPDGTYSDGPLLGLEEIRIRKKEKTGIPVEASFDKQITYQWKKWGRPEPNLPLLARITDGSEGRPGETSVYSRGVALSPVISFNRCRLPGVCSLFDFASTDWPSPGRLTPLPFKPFWTVLRDKTHNLFSLPSSL